MILANAVYVVFGATGGIGSALSRRLLFGRYGAPSALVLAADHKDKLQQLQQQLQERSSGETKLEVVTADATDPDAVSGEFKIEPSRSGEGLNLAPAKQHSEGY
jgi:NAD(P)-dependent dehydrogenase (short-subunit alcohol dehydrogenase family)